MEIVAAIAGSWTCFKPARKPATSKAGVGRSVRPAQACVSVLTQPPVPCRHSADSTDGVAGCLAQAGPLRSQGGGVGSAPCSSGCAADQLICLPALPASRREMAGSVFKRKYWWWAESRPPGGQPASQTARPTSPPAGPHGPPRPQPTSPSAHLTLSPPRPQQGLLCCGGYGSQTPVHVFPCWARDKQEVLNGQMSACRDTHAQTVCLQGVPRMHTHARHKYAVWSQTQG